MEQKGKIKYRRNYLLGALGAALLIVGDLCLSIVPASPADKGLYVRGQTPQLPEGPAPPPLPRKKFHASAPCRHMEPSCYLILLFTFSKHYTHADRCTSQFVSTSWAISLQLTAYPL